MFKEAEQFANHMRMMERDLKALEVKVTSRSGLPHHHGHLISN